MSAEELIVLVDPAGNAIGTAPKQATHHENTPLHLAFSCYVFDVDGRLLVTQRAHDKSTFPGVWTNSFCGHPAPGEDLVHAVRRRGDQELGLDLRSVQLVLPEFRYEARSANGVLENELCPVFVAYAASDLHPSRSEVADLEWVAWSRFRDEVLSGARAVSAWCERQVPRLAGCELPGGGFRQGALTDLPPAAREVAG